MKKLIIMAALAVAAFGFSEASAQKVIKDAAGNVFLDVQDMPAGSFSTTTLNKVYLIVDAGNAVYKKLQVAKNVLPTKMNWATALGLANSYNTVTALNQTQGAANPKTGCAAYSEPGATSGWRVPTQRELQVLSTMNYALVQAGMTASPADFHWSSSEINATDSFFCNFADSSFGGRTNTFEHTVRCVREVN